MYSKRDSSTLLLRAGDENSECESESDKEMQACYVFVMDN